MFRLTSGLAELSLQVFDHAFSEVRRRLEPTCVSGDDPPFAASGQLGSIAQGVGRDLAEVDRTQNHIESECWHWQLQSERCSNRRSVTGPAARKSGPGKPRDQSQVQSFWASRSARRVRRPVTLILKFQGKLDQPWSARFEDPPEIRRGQVIDGQAKIGVVHDVE